jgi:hypothetical protein
MKKSDIQLDDSTIYMGVLTEEQKDLLIGGLYMTDSYFNPVQDLDNNWTISLEEMDQCEVLEFLWVKDLDLIKYNPKVDPDSFL